MSSNFVISPEGVSPGGEGRSVRQCSCIAGVVSYCLYLGLLSWTYAQAGTLVDDGVARDCALLGKVALRRSRCKIVVGHGCIVVPKSVSFGVVKTGCRSQTAEVWFLACETKQPPSKSFRVFVGHDVGPFVKSMFMPPSMSCWRTCMKNLLNRVGSF